MITHTQFGMNIITFSPSDDSDGVSSRFFHPLEDYPDKTEQKRYFQELVAGTTELVMSVYRTRKKHWGNKYLQYANEGIKNTVSSHVQVFHDRRQVGSIRFVTSQMQERLPLENLFNIRLWDEPKLEIGTFVIWENLPISLRNRVLVELWLGLVQVTAMYGTQYIFVFSDKAGCRLFQLFGFCPVRNYFDLTDQREITMDDSVADRDIVHPQREIMEARIWFMKKRMDYDNKGFLIRWYEQGTKTAFSLDNPYLRNRLEQMGLLHVFDDNARNVDILTTIPFTENNHVENSF